MFRAEPRLEVAGWGTRKVRLRMYVSSWTLGDPLFKYVDAVDAHYLECGSIKIGTLRGYGQLEGARADAGENTFESHIE